MNRSSTFLDDLAGVAGGAVSTLAGLREEARAMRQARRDALARRFDLVGREEFDAMAELAANARAEAEAVSGRIAALEARLAVLEGLLGAAGRPEDAV